MTHAMKKHFIFNNTVFRPKYLEHCTNVWIRQPFPYSSEMIYNEDNKHSRLVNGWKSQTNGEFDVVDSPFFDEKDKCRQDKCSLSNSKHYLHTAIIIEPRKHPAMEFVLNNFLENLNESWMIVVIHGNLNIDFLNEIVETKLSKYKHRIHTVHLHVDNLNLAEYSAIFFREEFYKCIPTETFLVFQTDTMIFKKNRDKINDFLDFDYVGAPWKLANNHITSIMAVGNGGLSLRKKSKMLELLKYKNAVKNLPPIAFAYEDMYFNGFFFTNWVNVKKPCYDNAKQFSVETVFHNSPFGIHACWTHLTDEEINVLIEEEPHLKTLIGFFYPKTTRIRQDDEVKK